MKPGTGAEFGAEKAVRFPETPQVVGQTGAARQEREPCPFQNRENALTDLEADRIIRQKRLNLMPRNLPIGRNALRNVTFLPLPDCAAQFAFGFGDR